MSTRPMTCGKKAGALKVPSIQAVRAGMKKALERIARHRTGAATHTAKPTLRDHGYDGAVRPRGMQP